MGKNNRNFVKNAKNGVVSEWKMFLSGSAELPGHP
jgi:hypothetical protein